MLDPKLLRENLDFVQQALNKRNMKFDLSNYVGLEEKRKELQLEVENLQNIRNKTSKAIGIAKSKGESTDSIMAEVASIGENLKQKNHELNQVQLEIKDLVLKIPNIVNDEIPLGKSEEDNKEIKKWGTIPTFSFEPKDHVDLGARNYGLDMQAGAKLSGARFVVLRDKMARLHRALAQFMLDLHTGEHGYTEVNVPYIVGLDALQGTGQLPNLEDDLFYTHGEGENHKMGLIPTSEVSLTNLVRDEIIDRSQLPIKYTAHSACFRREAGSYGKDTRGMIRVHQFEKVELVNICAKEDSYQCLEQMLKAAENVLQKLELPYRVVELCSGDIGFCAAKTYDIEVWLPSQKCYREISSCSNCTDFQARRMQARTRQPDTNKPELIHTLNGSGVAVGRALVAVLENYQMEDGTIRVPEVLKPYMGGVETI